MKSCQCLVCFLLFAVLLCDAADDMVPFVEKICESPLWIRELGTANVGYAWANGNKQTILWRQYMGQLCRAEVLSDSFGYKLDVLFGVDPVSSWQTQ